MASSNIKDVLRNLISYGLDIKTPVGIITNVSCYNQNIKISTIYAELNSQKEIKSPSILIIGDVVKFYSDANWFNNKKKFLFTGTNPSQYENLGYIVDYQMLEIKSIDDFHELDNILKNIKNYNWIIFTSKYAVIYFFKRINELKKDSRELANIKIISIGLITTQTLSNYGIIPDITLKNESSAGIISFFKKQGISNQKILLPRSYKALVGLPNFLIKLGNIVDAVVVYKNERANSVRNIDFKYIDGVIFTSPSCVKNFKFFHKSIPEHFIVYSIGSVTKKTIQKEFKNAKIISIKK